MSRATQEWIAKHDDQKIPDYVRLRVFNKFDGVCYLSRRKIRAGETWELEHVTALCNGGQHRESNFAPALCAPHKEKTKADRAMKAKNDKVRKSHFGIRGASKMQSRGFDKARPQHSASRPIERTR